MMRTGLNPTQLLCILILSFFSCKDDESVPSVLRESDLPVVVDLPTGMLENSGIVPASPSSLWAINDSGDAPKIYEIGLEEPAILKTVVLSNASNMDWEAITADNDHLYIGDFGNNNGDRTDLVVYKIVRPDLNASDTLEPQAIIFTYEDQTDFTPSDQHNFDCEAMIHWDDQLYLFSKNRADLHTNVYTLLAAPGEQVARHQDRFDIGGLITDAATNDSKTVVCLLGYNVSGMEYKPFLWFFYDFPGSSFSEGKRMRIDLELNRQTEAVCFAGNQRWYFTSERETGGAAYVYVLDAAGWLE